MQEQVNTVNQQIHLKTLSVTEWWS